MLRRPKEFVYKTSQMVQFMQEFDYKIKYVHGQLNKDANTLSKNHKEKHEVSLGFIKKLMSITTIQEHEKYQKHKL